MAETLRIAHCSDIHLDGDGHPADAGGDAREGYRRAFARALAEMRAHRPDLMLLAGDLFDANDATPETIRWAMEILGRQPYPVIMIPGNHDCMENGAIYRRYDFNSIANVRMLSAEAGEVARLDALGVAVWGKGMVDHSTAYRPLGGCPGRPDGCRWFLGLGHGIFVPDGESSHRSSPIHMREIEASPCDYLALGHHHAVMELLTAGTAAAYSGSPTDSIGRGATYVIADLAPGRPAEVAVHVMG
ncbi:MAG: metallophosphoesterase family protein [Geminicoccales bacterium]